ncbi:MAG: hypothetical protein WC100_01390 [Sterolibacterium sp.]
MRIAEFINEVNEMYNAPTEHDIEEALAFADIENEEIGYLEDEL